MAGEGDLDFARADFLAAASLQDNILFGKAAYGHARGTERIGAVMAEVIDSLGLREAVMEVGLDFQVGIGGSRLTSAQRQKLALARAVLKRPDVLVLNEATAAVDSASESRIRTGLLEEFRDRGVVWVLHRASLAKYFGKILVMRGGRIVEQGTFDRLDRDGSVLKELIGAE